VPLPWPTVLPFPVARHRSDAPVCGIHDKTFCWPCTNSCFSLENQLLSKSSFKECIRWYHPWVKMSPYFMLLNRFDVLLPFTRDLPFFLAEVDEPAIK